ncbi:MAG: hypothetical protein AB1610_02805 [Nitrospirota bacterium]
MTYTEAIKSGFGLINRNWQLLLIQIAAAIISTIVFLIMVGIPLTAALIIAGADFAEIRNMEDIMGALKESSALISRYFGIILMVITCFLLYIIMITCFGIYVFGGSVGSIGKALIDKALKFNIRTFFDEAKRLFSRLLGFTAVMGVFLILISFLLGILVGSIGALISFTKEQDTTFALFFGTFFSLILIIIGLFFFLSTLSITLYGIVLVVFKNTGPLESVREAIRYLYRHPSALWLFTILLAGYIFVSFLLILINYLFASIPLIGVFLSFLYQITLNIFQIYLGLGIIGTIFTYYYSTEILSRHVVENSMPQTTVQDKI